jgi:hypothetical protein
MKLREVTEFNDDNPITVEDICDQISSLLLKGEHWVTKELSQHCRDKKLIDSLHALFTVTTPHVVSFIAKLNSYQRRSFDFSNEIKVFELYSRSAPICTKIVKKWEELRDLVNKS